MEHDAGRFPARTPHPSSSTVATALSHAFLAAPQWTTDALASAGAGVLGARRRWLGPLARDVVGAYHHKPADAPRELAAYIGASGPFTDAVAKARAQRKPIRLAAYVVAGPELRQEARRVPDIAGLDELAAALCLTPGELDWFADTRHWNRLAGRGPLQHYRYAWRERPGRTPRLLEIPGMRLRAVQRKALEELLAPIPLHGAAHGFVPGRSAASGAGCHTGTDVVISLDLLSFFAKVTAGKVFGALRLPHLPQGAPTSPALANVALRRLDSRLQGWADKVGANYTRYADDLSFSGGPALARRADSFVRGVERIVAAEGHVLNGHKTRVRPRGTRQQVTGVVANQHVNAPRHEFETLKAVLHNCVHHGPDAQNRAGHPDFRAHLLGRITWMESLNSARGLRLRRDFDRISW